MTGPTRNHTCPGVRPERAGPDFQDAQYASLLAVDRTLAAEGEGDMPKVVLFERDGVLTVYVSTLGVLGPSARADVAGAVQAALAPYTRPAAPAPVVFLTRGRA